MHTGFWRENLKEGDHLEKARVDDGIILKVILLRVGRHELHLSGKMMKFRLP